jgi:phosphohistidine phosphatase
MRLLTLIRHAKSSWDDSSLSDFERPLNERGQRDAPVMAARAVQFFERPDRLISSPALRAITTARIFAQTLKISDADIVIQQKIYAASAGSLLNIVQSFSDSDHHVMLFGHNPGLSDLAHLLAPSTFDGLPTCGIAHLALSGKTWDEAAPDCGDLLRFTYPKETATR